MFLMEARPDLLAQADVVDVNQDGQLKILSDITNVDCVCELQVGDAGAAVHELALGAPFEVAKDVAHVRDEAIAIIRHQTTETEIHGNILGQYAEGTENSRTRRNQDLEDSEFRSDRGCMERSGAAISDQRVVGGTKPFAGRHE